MLCLLFYRCICEAPYTGKTCESEINICLTNSPCQNNAPCSITDTGYRCDCPLGYAGDNCEYGMLNTGDYYHGNGYITKETGSHLCCPSS